MLLSTGASSAATGITQSSIIFFGSHKAKLSCSAFTSLKYCLLTKHFLSGIVTNSLCQSYFWNKFSVSPSCFEQLRGDHRNYGRIEVCLQVWCWSLQWNQLFLNNYKSLLCQNFMTCNCKILDIWKHREFIKSAAAVTHMNKLLHYGNRS